MYCMLTLLHYGKYSTQVWSQGYYGTHLYLMVLYSLLITPSCYNSCVVLTMVRYIAFSYNVKYSKISTQYKYN